MKKLYLFVLLGLCMPAAAEMVSTISYNPSRLGRYSSLKISNSAAFLDGLDVAENLNIKSTTHMTNKTFGNFNFDVIQGTNATIDMPETVFHNSDSWEQATNAANVPTSFGSLEVNMAGGEASFNEDSFVQSLIGNNLLVDAQTIQNSSQFAISGEEGNSISLAGGATTMGFHLAGNDIPQPTCSHVYGNNQLNCTKGLKWIKRKTVDGQVVYVLGFDDCTATSCGDGTATPSATDCKTKCENSGGRYRNSSCICRTIPDIGSEYGYTLVYDTTTGCGYCKKVYVGTVTPLY